MSALQDAILYSLSDRYRIMGSGFYLYRLLKTHCKDRQGIPLLRTKGKIDAIEHALKTGDIHLVLLLCNLRNFSECIPFVVRISLGNIKVCKWLLHNLHGLDVHHVQYWFEQSIRSGNIALSKWLYRRYDIRIDALFDSAELTAYYGHLHTIEWLINKGNKDFGRFFYGACMGDRVYIVEWLLEKYPKSRYNIDNGLREALFRNSINVVRLLVEKHDAKMTADMIDQVVSISNDLSLGNTKCISYLKSQFPTKYYIAKIMHNRDHIISLTSGLLGGISFHIIRNNTGLIKYSGIMMMVGASLMFTGQILKCMGVK